MTPTTSGSYVQSHIPNKVDGSSHQASTAAAGRVSTRIILLARQMQPGGAMWKVTKERDACE